MPTANYICPSFKEWDSSFVLGSTNHSYEISGDGFENRWSSGVTCSAAGSTSRINDGPDAFSGAMDILGRFPCQLINPLPIGLETQIADGIQTTISKSKLQNRYHPMSDQAGNVPVEILHAQKKGDRPESSGNGFDSKRWSAHAFKAPIIYLRMEDNIEIQQESTEELFSRAHVPLGSLFSSFGCANVDFISFNFKRLMHVPNPHLTYKSAQSTTNSKNRDWLGEHWEAIINLIRDGTISSLYPYCTSEISNASLVSGSKMKNIPADSINLVDHLYKTSTSGTANFPDSVENNPILDCPVQNSNVVIFQEPVLSAVTQACHSTVRDTEPIESFVSPFGGDEHPPGSFRWLFVCDNWHNNYFSQHAQTIEGYNYSEV